MVWILLVLDVDVNYFTIVRHEGIRVTIINFDIEWNLPALDLEVQISSDAIFILVDR